MSGESDSESASSLSDVEFDEGYSGSYTCLLCETVNKSADNLFEHLQTQHDWNILPEIDRFKDQYSWITFVNWARSKKPRCWSEFFDLSEDKKQKFLQPTLSEDDVLTIDVESLANRHDNDMDTASSKKTLEQLREENIDLICQLNKCRKLLVETIDGPAYGAGDRGGSFQIDLNGDSNTQLHPFAPPYCGLPAALLALRDSISHSAYRNFVHLNAAKLFSGKTILHLAAGPGLLTMYLASARPKRIFAVEASKDLAMALWQVAASNKVEECVEVCEGRMNDLQRSSYRGSELDSEHPGDSLVKLNNEKVDAIFCDWMGPLLFYRSNLPAVMEAARAHLRLPGGRIYPRHAVLGVAGLECSQHLLQAYCLDTASSAAATAPFLQSTLYAALRGPLCRLAYVADVSAEVAAGRARVLTRPIAAAAAYGQPAPAARIEVDLLSLSSSGGGLGALPSSHDFALLVEGPRGGADGVDCQLNALVAYFDCRMDDDAEFNMTFSTSPSAKSTHYAQTIFFLEHPISVSSGDRISGTLFLEGHQPGNCDDLSVRICLRHPELPEPLDYHYRLNM